jgi:hypothetical protein
MYSGSASSSSSSANALAVVINKHEDRPAGKSLGDIKKLLGQDDNFPHTDESVVFCSQNGNRLSGDHGFTCH